MTMGPSKNLGSLAIEGGSGDRKRDVGFPRLLECGGTLTLAAWTL